MHIKNGLYSVTVESDDYAELDGTALVGKRSISFHARLRLLILDPL
jgi:hypothetical protein